MFNGGDLRAPVEFLYCPFVVKLEFLNAINITSKFSLSFDPLTALWYNLRLFEVSMLMDW